MWFVIVIALSFIYCISTRWLQISGLFQGTANFCWKHMWENYILITNLMHRLLFIYKLSFLYMFRATNTHLQEDTLYTCSIWYCHSLRKFVVACRYTSWVLTPAVYRQAATNSRRVRVPYAARIQCILKMSICGSKHVEQRFSNFFQVGTTFISQNVLRTTLLWDYQTH